MTADLLDALEARSGIVCAIGAGGKKTTMYAIAGHHPGRVAITATVHIPYFPQDLAAVQVVDPEADLLDSLASVGEARCVAYACPGNKAGRFAGVGPALIRRIHDQFGFDLTLVKADGARMRWLKAAKPGEPVLPPGTETILVVVSARAIGEPLGERTAQRPERVARVTGAVVGRPFSPQHLARLVTCDGGLLSGTGNTRVIPVINMVDDRTRRRLAIEAADSMLAASTRFDRVVLAQMRHVSDPLVDVIRR